MGERNRIKCLTKCAYVARNLKSEIIMSNSPLIKNHRKGRVGNDGKCNMNIYDLEVLAIGTYWDINLSDRSGCSDRCRINRMKRKAL